MIKSIRLLNWRSHADTVLDFREGTNLLVGAMGSGKSSVLNAIAFALFGTFPELDRRKLRLQDLFRMNEDKAAVTIEFAWNGSQYKVERRLTRSKKKVDSEAEVFQHSKIQDPEPKTADWKLVDSGPVAVTGYIERLLAVDYDLFTRAIYSEQNNIDYFLTLDPRRRKQELDQLLGLDRFETTRANIISVINRLKSNRKVLEQKFSQEQMQETRDKIKAQEKEIRQMQEEQSAIIQQEEKQRTDLQQAESGFSEMKKSKEKHENLSKERLRLEASASQLTSDLEGKQADEQEFGKKKAELSGLQKEKEESAALLRQADSQLSDSSKQIGSLEARLKHIEKSAKELDQNTKRLKEMLGEDTLEQMEQNKSELEKEAISLFSEKKSLSANIEETEELLRSIKPGLSTCPLCESRLGEQGTERLIQEKKRNIDVQRKKIRELESAIEEKKKLFAGLASRLKSIDSINSSIAGLEKEIGGRQEIEKELEEASGKMKARSASKASIEESARKLDKRIQSLVLEADKLEQLLKKKRQLDEASRKLQETLKLIETLGFDEKLFEEKRGEIEKARIALQQTVSDKASLEKQMSMLSQMFAQLRKELEQMESIEKDIRQYADLEEQLAIYRNALLETQTSLRSNLTDAINSAMKEIWSIFYPYRNYPSIRLSVTDKDYLFEVIDNEEWKALESIASGGERACAALTLRVALAMVLTPNLSWLILDEPTHNLDAQAVSLLSGTLQTRVPEVVKQTFVITHEEGLMGADFSTSYRLSRDRSGTGPTKAEYI